MITSEVLWIHIFVEKALSWEIQGLLKEQRIIIH